MATLTPHPDIPDSPHHLRCRQSRKKHCAGGGRPVKDQILNRRHIASNRTSWLACKSPRICSRLSFAVFSMLMLNAKHARFEPFRLTLRYKHGRTSGIV
jgi:hypothetical protein